MSIILISIFFIFVIIAYISYNKYGVTHQGRVTEKNDISAINITANKERWACSHPR